MGAARRKGKWVGGTPVLGYDVDPAGGRLVINEPEAQRVREIFRLFKTHRSLLKLVNQLEARRWRNKSWKSKSGVEHVGRPFPKPTLRSLLTTRFMPARWNTGTRSIRVSTRPSSRLRFGKQ